MKPLISCKELVDFLGDYYEGDLATPTRTEFDRHLAACPSCVHYVESYKATIEMSRAALCQGSSALPPDVPEELVKAILAARKQTG